MTGAGTSPSRDAYPVVLQVEDLSIAFPHTGKEGRVVEGVRFDLRQGMTLGIVGESGSGKTLTSLSILRLLPPGGEIRSGRILLYPGESRELALHEMTEEQMKQVRGKRISMIFQEPMTSLNPSMRCGHQLAELLRLHEGMSRKDARRETMKWFAEVKLPHPERVYGAYPHELSGGQRQRVMIAMAVCTHPAVLIADEPTTALDVTIQKSVISLLRELQHKYGISILFISHDLALIGEIAHRTLVMQQGQVVEEGKTEDILTHPQHPYTRGLLHCRPSFQNKPKRLPTIRDYLEKGKVRPLDPDPEAEKERKKEIYAQPPILEVRGLSTWFSQRTGWAGQSKEMVRAVDGVDFRVFRGETLGLVGESGCGKTTLGRSLLNLVKAGSGSVIYQGKNSLAFTGKELKAFRRKFQIIFQDPFSSLNPRITVGEAIIEPMKVHGLYSSREERRQAMLSLLERVRLKPVHADRFPHEFSGGQRQRIGIARALALRPEFVICDESVSSLDVSVQAEILNLLNSLKEDFGLTYVFISHDLSVVKYMSDRVLVMREGKIIESGEAEAVFLRPAEAYTRELIEAVPGRETPATY